MTAAEKNIEKMKRQPNGISPAEADSVLTAKGYMFSRQTGSHCHYINAE